jgi:putative protease
MSSNRGFTTGMFFGKHLDDGYNHDDEKAYRMSHELVGVVQSVHNGKAVIALRNTIKIGDSIEFLTSGLENKSFSVKELCNIKGAPVGSGRNEETILMPVHPGVCENDLIRRPLATGSNL